jgi:acetate---CoA ligase (ADP-forming)
MGSGTHAVTAITPNLRKANLARLLAPASIAFVGGGNAEWAIGALGHHAFAGRVYAVHPKRETMAGHRCYATVADLPEVPDAVYLAVPADATVTAVAQMAQLGVGGVVCYASGFSELGEVGQAINRQLVEAAGDMALVGPNCYGIINYVNGGSLWSSDYLPVPARRGVAIIGQSGNVCIHLSSSQRSVPFSYLISAGNQAVLGFEDYIDHLVDDPAVSCIGLFMEGIRDVPDFARACLRARARRIPVIVCRSGVSDLGAAMAASHTSSLAGQNEFYDALFRRLGVITTETVPQFLEMLKLAALCERVGGNRLAVFSSSGGDNGLAADACSLAGLALPQPDPAQAAAIAAGLPGYAHVSNPLDFTAGYWGRDDLLTPMFTTMLAEGYDMGLMVMDHPPIALGGDVGGPIRAMVRALAAAGRATGKPVMMASVNPESIPGDVRDWMIDQGVVPMQGLHDAGKVLAKWTQWSTWIAQDRDEDRPTVPFAAAGPPTGAVRTWNEHDSKQALAGYGLAVPPARVASLAELALDGPEPGAPMALKVLHDAIPHKTEMGAVVLNLATADQLRVAARGIVRSVRAKAPDLIVERFLIEPMQPAPLAELIVGIKRDPLFGLVLVLGAGGVLVELLQDARQLILPASREDIERELRQLRCFVLVDGFRGKPRADIGKVVDAIAAVAAYAADHREHLVELDVNPLMVFADKAVAVDALIVTAEP